MYLERAIYPVRQARDNGAQSMNGQTVRWCCIAPPETTWETQVGLN